MKFILKSLLSAAFCLAISPMVQGGLIISDDFDSNTVSGGSGWNSNWNLAAGNSISGNTLNLLGDNNNAATRTLGPISSSNFNEVLIAFDLTYSWTGNKGANNFAAFWFSSADSSNPNFGLKDNDSGNPSFFSRESGTSGTYVPGVNAVSSQTYRIEARIFDSNNGNTWDSIQVRVDGSPWVTATSGTWSLQSFSTIGFRTANLGSNESITIDNLSLSAIPEPTAMLLVGSVIGLAGLRRRRNG